MLSKSLEAQELREHEMGTDLVQNAAEVMFKQIA